MSKKAIATPAAPAAIGPYSQGTRYGNLVFTSGQLPLHPVSGELICDVAGAAQQAMDNVKAVLEAGGSSLEQVVKVTIFLKSMDDFAVVNQVYGTYFAVNAPARACVQVAKLPKDAVLEIEAIGGVEA